MSAKQLRRNARADTGTALFSGVGNGGLKTSAGDSLEFRYDRISSNKSCPKEAQRLPAECDNLLRSGLPQAYLIKLRYLESAWIPMTV